jgi:hypothetical protein
MLKIFRAVPLILILVLAPIGHLVRAQQPANDVKQTEKVKTEISKRGTGQKANVTVKLRDGSEVKGFVAQAGENNFTVTDKKTGRQTEIAYVDVAKVKGRGLSTWAKVGIVTAIAVGVLAIVVIIGLRDFDFFEGGILNNQR